MPITLEEIMAKVPEERQKKIIARAEELKKEERQKIVWKMSDEDINFRYIPEINEDFFNTAKRIEHPRKSKTNND
jgi:hypothetical protein